MSEYAKVPLPSEEMYSAAVDELIRADQITSLDALERIIKRETFRDRSFAIGMRNAQYWGKVVEPQDRSTKGSVHDTLPVTNAIRLGSGFGFALIPHVHRGFVSVDDAIANIPYVNQPTTKDQFQARHELADEIVGIGDLGISFMGPGVNDRLMDLEMLMVEDAKHQRMFRIGCGIVALGGFIAHEKRLQELERQELHQFEKSLESLHEVDWDDSFARLLEGGQS